MNPFLFPDLSLAIPLLILPGGICSNKVTSIIEKVAENVIEVDTQSLVESKSICQNKQIGFPSKIAIQPIACSNLEDFVQIRTMINEQGFFIHQIFSILVVIDATLNDFPAVRAGIERTMMLDKSPIQNKLSFVLFNCSNDDVHYFKQNEVCLTFQNTSEASILNYFQVFISSICIHSFMNAIDMQNILKYPFLLPITLSCVSANKTKVFDLITGWISKIAADYKNKGISYLFGLLGLYEMRYPGILSKMKFNYDKMSNLSSAWNIDFVPNDMEVRCYATGNSFLSKGDEPEMIDLCLRAIDRGYPQYINQCVKLLRTSETDAYKVRSIQFVFICLRRGFFRQGSYFSFRFFRSYNSPEFLLALFFFMLNVTDKKILHSLFVDVVNLILGFQVSIDLELKVRAVITVLTSDLPAKTQKNMFSIIKEKSRSSLNLVANLNFPVDKVTVVNDFLTFSPIKKVEKPLLLFGAFDKPVKSNILYFPIEKEIAVEVEIQNLFAFSFDGQTEVLSSDIIKGLVTPCKINETSRNKILLRFIPILPSPFVLSTFNLLFHSLIVSINIEPIQFHFIQNAPLFSLKSSFSPATVLYDGEILSFSLTLTNLCTAPIVCSNIKFSFPQVKTDLDTSHVINPYEDYIIECSLIASTELKQLCIDVFCGRDDFHFSACVSQTIHVSCSSGISLKSISPIKWTGSQTIQILGCETFVLEISNSSGQPFNYTASFDFDHNHQYALSQKVQNGIIHPNSRIVFFVPVSLELLQNFPSQAGTKPFVLLLHKLEESQNRHVTESERKSIDKLCSLSKFITEKLTFNWFLEPNRTGIMSTENIRVSHDSLASITNMLPKVLMTFTLDGAVIKEIPCSTMVTFTVKNLSNLSLKEVQLDFGGFLNPEHEIFWDGSLLYSDTDLIDPDKNEFIFHLLFCNPDNYQFHVKMKYQNFADKCEEVSFQVVS